ncbi:MAG TPA: NAD-binding protein, partial [Acidimicrobiales bacterium]
MADGGGGGRWGRRIFLGFVALTVVSLVLGYLGLLLRARSSPELRTHWWDLLYWDLQLFVLDSEPAADGHAMPILLHIARFTAPAVTAYALVRTAYALFERRLHEWAAQRSRRHVIVCGFEPATAGLVRELAEAGERVVVIAEQPVDAGALPRRVAAIVGDPRTEEVLRRAG